MLTGPELRLWREAAGLMRRELAGMLGASVDEVKRAERGEGELLGAAYLLSCLLGSVAQEVRPELDHAE